MAIILLESFAAEPISGQNSTIVLSVNPSSGVKTENIEIQCQLPSSEAESSSSLTKVENVYLIVETNEVKPSGILLMFNDLREKCEENRRGYFQVDVCNSKLISIRINQTVLNETIDKIEYSCTKGNRKSTSSYKIISKSLILRDLIPC